MATEVMSAEILQLETVDELLAKRLLSRGLNRGAFCRRFDKGGLVRWHMAAAREYRRLEGENSLLPRIYHMVEKKRASEPLEALEKIDIRYGTSRKQKGPPSIDLSAPTLDSSMI